MALFMPPSARHQAWPWTRNVERILRVAQPAPFVGEHLFLGSDYSGSHKTSRFNIYGYLVADTDRSPRWPAQSRLVRRRLLPDRRRMSFKSLGDRYRQRALVPFLQAADTLTGHLVVLAVTKDVARISTGRRSLEILRQEKLLRTNWKQTSFESAFRTAHIFALLLGLWSRPQMDVTWIMDEDEVIANARRLDDVQQLAALISSLYVPHTFRIFAMNSTGADNGLYEDVVAIPDLAAGMVGEVAARIEGQFGDNEQTSIDPRDFTEKSQIIADWFWWPHASLRRTCILIERASKNQFHSRRLQLMS